MAVCHVVACLQNEVYTNFYRNFCDLNVRKKKNMFVTSNYAFFSFYKRDAYLQVATINHDDDVKIHMKTVDHPVSANAAAK